MIRNAPEYLPDCHMCQCHTVVKSPVQASDVCMSLYKASNYSYDSVIVIVELSAVLLQLLVLSTVHVF